jgi:hypothetical protein
MLSRISIALLAFISVALAPLQAQDQAAAAEIVATIAKDRPSVTDSSIVDPLGSVQTENGFLETANQGQSIVEGPETMLRLGIAAKTELRFTVPGYFDTLNAVGGGGTGFGDFAVGVKQQLGPTPGGFDVSPILFFSFPTGAKGVSSGRYDAQVAWSRGLSAKWTVAGMLSLYWPTQGRSRNVTGEAPILLDRQLTGRWDAFVEYAGDSPERGGSRHLMHLGTSPKLTKQQQLDFHVGVGLSSASVDHVIGIGYSFRFQAFDR